MVYTICSVTLQCIVLLQSQTCSCVMSWCVPITQVNQWLVWLAEPDEESDEEET